MITTITSTIRSLLAPRRRAPGRHRRGIPALELLAHLGTGTAVSAPTGWHVPRNGGVGAARALHVQSRSGHPDHPGGGVMMMRTVEEIVDEIDAAIADSGSSCARHHDAPGREPALALLERLGAAVRRPPSSPSPSADDTIVMEVIR